MAGGTFVKFLQMLSNTEHQAQISKSTITICCYIFKSLFSSSNSGKSSFKSKIILSYQVNVGGMANP